MKVDCKLVPSRGASVNDGIPLERCSLKYLTVDNAIQTIKQLSWAAGGHSWLNGILRMPTGWSQFIHKTKLLGMFWKGQMFIDTVLPFGLRSAPKIFTAVANAPEYILQQQRVSHIMYYLDDYLLFGSPGTSDYQIALYTTMQECSSLGVPIAEHKTEGPTQALTFLGIEVDTERMKVRLPVEKPVPARGN